MFNRHVVLALPPAQAGQACGRNRTRIFSAIKNKELQAVKDGKATVIMIAELYRWLSTLPTIGRDAEEPSTLATVAADAEVVVGPQKAAAPPVRLKRRGTVLKARARDCSD